MKPLYHPLLSEISVQGILHALSDPIRVSILAQLLNADCAKNCSAFLLINNTPLAKSTLSQHFKVLRESGLIYSERKGVELHNTTRCEELQEKFGSMIEEIIKAYIAEAKKEISQ